MAPRHRGGAPYRPRPLAPPRADPTLAPGPYPLAPPRPAHLQAAWRRGRWGACARARCRGRRRRRGTSRAPRARRPTKRPTTGTPPGPASTGCPSRRRRCTSGRRRGSPAFQARRASTSAAPCPPGPPPPRRSGPCLHEDASCRLVRGLANRAGRSLSMEEKQRTRSRAKTLLVSNRLRHVKNYENSLATLLQLRWVRQGLEPGQRPAAGIKTRVFRGLERASDCFSPSGRQRLAAAAEARRVRRGAAPAIAEHAGRRGRVGSGLGPRRGERGGTRRSRLVRVRVSGRVRVRVRARVRVRVRAVAGAPP